MKKLIKAIDIKKAAELVQIIGMRRLLDKQELELKKYFKEIIGSDDAMLIGDSFVIMMESQMRTYLDKERLETDLGNLIHDYEIVQNVRILRIKNTNGNEI